MNSVCRRMLVILFLGWPVIAPSGIGVDLGLRGDNPPGANNFRGFWRVDTFSACDGDTGKVKEPVQKGKPACTMSISADDKLTIMIEGVKSFQWSIACDVKKKPVWIDLTPLFPQVQKEKRKGLLELKDDRLIIHFGTRGSDARPAGFKQRKGLSSILIVCKKVK